MKIDEAYKLLMENLDRYENVSFIKKQVKIKKQKKPFSEKMESVVSQIQNILQSCPKIDEYIKPDSFNYAFFESDLERLLFRIKKDFLKN